MTMQYDWKFLPLNINININEKYKNYVSFSLNEKMDNGNTWMHWCAKFYKIFVECNKGFKDLYW